MAMKRLFSMVAVLSLTIGAGFASLPVQAEPPAPIAASAAPTLGSGLPVVVPGSKLIEARYWRYRYHYHHRYWRHYHWRRHYYYHRYYHHYYHRRHYRHWHYRHYYRY
jgi:hypothetical protein